MARLGRVASSWLDQGPAAAPTLPTAGIEEAKLRALLLRQRADGLFDADLGATLAAIAVLASRGHTAREGLFRSELGRALRALRARLSAGSKDERIYAALGVAILTLAAVPELPAFVAKHLARASTADLATLGSAVRAALAAAPPGWDSGAGTKEILGAFGW
jgi:hypothetical protein